MAEITFFLFIMIFSGYTVGRIFISTCSKIRQEYDVESYFAMILYIFTLPFIPILWFVMMFLAGIGVQFYYILMTGQL